MKKILTVLLVMLVSISVFAAVIPVSAAEDLLAESGYGDFAYLKENGIDVTCSEWCEHCDWQLHTGYLGFRLSGYDLPQLESTREIIETTLSDGSQGYALHSINDSGANCFINLALENMDILCGGLEEGKTYRVVVVAKVMERQYATTPIVQVNAYEPTEMIIDGQWHTYETEFTYNSADATPNALRTHANWGGSEYKDTYAITLKLGSFGVQGDVAEIFYESIQVFEADNTPTGDAVFAVVAAFTLAISAALVLAKKRAF